MKLTAISDLHGNYPKLDGGDLLILAGDYTANSSVYEWATFFNWLKAQPYDKKVVVAGNHDNLLDIGFPKDQEEADSLKEVQEYIDYVPDFEYLCDSGCEYDGFKIWGTPWTNSLVGVNPSCAHFMLSEGQIKEKYAKSKMFDQEIDILISHGPPLGILDLNMQVQQCGSLNLKLALDEIKPMYHFFGHIHEQGGKEFLYKHEGLNTRCYNCSYVDVLYKPKNKILNLEI